MNRDTGFWAYMLIIIVVAALSLGRGVLVSQDEAVQAAETLGFSDITVTGSQWLLAGFAGCDNQDAAAFNLTATNPTGQTVNVVMCSGWPLKGMTMRVR